MPILIRYLTPQGDLISPDFQAQSLDEVSALEPDGIYTITRTFHTDKVVMLDAHMQRLEESAQLEGIDLNLDHAWLRSGLHRLIQQAGYDESRFRITIPREDPQTALLAVEPLSVLPESLRAAGVQVATICIDRPNPRAKSNRWIQLREEARQQLPGWAYEGLVCNSEGVILEGFSSNFYAVNNGKLRTAEGRVLSGIGRKILLTVAPDLLEIVYEPIRLNEVTSLDEAMLTSSSRGIVPIVSIDERIIGTGKPGPITQELWRRYQSWVKENLEKI